MTRKQKRQEQAKIDDAFYRLARICEGTHDWDRFTYQEEREERDHVKHKPDSLPRQGISVPKAARLFAVRHILQGRDGQAAPTADDIFSIRLSVFMSQALYKRHKTPIDEAFTPEETKELLAIDYAEHAKAEGGGRMSKPTTEASRAKWYKCSQCGYAKEITTNHYGECYSFGSHNTCPDCPPFKRPTTWQCAEQPPANMTTPEKWATATIIIKTEKKNE